MYIGGHNAIFILTVFSLLPAGCSSNGAGESNDHRGQLIRVDRYTPAGRKHLFRDYAAVDSSGNVNVVVEIPAGTNEKWEVDKSTGELKWDFKRGKPRIVSHIGYPVNYGMIPGTFLPEQMGGDGDPLDVIIIGPAIGRGRVVAVRLVGVLKILDDGEIDNKIIALLPGSSLHKISGMKELRDEYKWITDIIKIWFSHYKDPEKMVLQGFGDAAEARIMLDTAIAAYHRYFLQMQ
ncbi:MAG: inorganic diphosphatase [Chitinivibrionales bacterium]|nr:inorganic diphosphatase [Chitinivibrionales bacterium]